MIRFGRRDFLKSLAGGVALLPFIPEIPGDSISFAAISAMKTRAVGRHLIDLPDGFEPLARNEVILYFGTDENARKIVAETVRLDSGETFDALAAKTAAALSADNHFVLKRPMLIAQNTALGGRFRLVRSYADSLVTEAFDSEALCLVGSDVVRLKAKSFKRDPEIIERRMQEVAESMAEMTAEDQPGRGFCLGRVMIGADHDQEIGTFNFKSPLVPEALVSLSANAFSPNPDPGLLSRWDKNFFFFMRLIPGAPSVMRRRTIKLAGMTAEELLSRATIKGRKAFKFAAESMRPDPGLVRPLLHLELDTEPVGPEEQWKPPVWDRREAIRTWDEIVASVRLRPGAV